MPHTENRPKNWSYLAKIVYNIYKEIEMEKLKEMRSPRDLNKLSRRYKGGLIEIRITFKTKRLWKKNKDRYYDLLDDEMMMRVGDNASRWGVLVQEEVGYKTYSYHYHLQDKTNIAITDMAFTFTNAPLFDNDPSVHIREDKKEKTIYAFVRQPKPRWG